MFSLIYEFRDKIIIEVSAHDHFSDLRYHSNGDDSNKIFYHNLLVSPGISPVKNQNPGVAIFEIDSQTFIPHNLKMLFAVLDQTYGLKSGETFPFRTVTFSDFGLT